MIHKQFEAKWCRSGGEVLNMHDTNLTNQIRSFLMRGRSYPLVDIDRHGRIALLLQNI